MQRNSIAGEAIADPHSQHFMDRFCDLLQARNILDSAGVQRARRAQQQSGERFDLVLMRLGLITDYRLAEALAEFCGYRLYSRGDFPDEAVLPEKLQLKFLKANRILPIGVEPGVIRLAVADPFNAEARSALSFLLDRRLECGIAPEGEIDRAIDRLYGHGGERDEAGDGAAGSATEAASEDDVRRLEDMASEAPVIKLVRRLIVRAVEAQASDIHVEPLEDCVQVRFRIDGVLHVVETLSLGMRAAIGSRIKIMARLNIAERRLPQDGRIKENVRGREVDLRVSTMPTMWGESIVMRILDRSSIELDFPSLGFAGASYEAFGRMLHEPNGIILVTGPTGSGKTTTLYTALRQLNSTERKVFTVEDPIEYHLEGINQIQVQPRIGLTFASALRSILRQDPDIIMVGEIRDLETAQVAIQAALTGHLVLSTVHTNGAAATVTRLLDMGVEKYLLASCIKGVLAQRLVRRLCSHCARPVAPSPALMELVGSARAGSGPGGAADHPATRKAVGCPTCLQKGYHGRTTVYELLAMSDRVREALMTAQSDQAIEKAAIDDGMQTMLQNGLAKVMRGETTAEEVLRVTRFERCQDTPTRPMTGTER
jgi:general secretion pathway protein E